MLLPKMEGIQLLGLSATTASEVSACESTLSLSSAMAMPLSIRIPLPGLGEQRAGSLSRGGTGHRPISCRTSLVSGTRRRISATWSSSNLKQKLSPVFPF
ncbi:hypothetical protein MLD38_013181 [Melastoma candidum]|uniref:Uncharacterized protein n=1 Tax=Melastoma candidum TaxID=119954 RepID=A0ACB9R8D1_9MYRT|nr:hypothetical protein MLD38_013181 [Melastoma candidum]